MLPVTEDQATRELIHVEVESFEVATSDGGCVSINGLGLVQVGRNNLSCQTASGWMVGKSGMEIRERVRGVLEECLRSLARKKTSTELASHWSGFGQLFDAEAGSVLARLGMEFIGFLPGREGS
jgi:uncharacterized membrane protein YqiK